MALTPGTMLGRYEIRSMIGAGGMGEVYLARDPKIGRDVAVKVLPPTFSSNSERLARFEQEAQAAGALNHPNILAIYDVDTEGETTYVVSELLEGETLRDAMGGTPMQVRKAVAFGQQVAYGLAAAHEKGIIHRDLKPENLFVTNDGRVKILDFGLAKLVETNGEKASSDLPTRRVNTDSGAIMGTAGYMSPEQLRGAKVDPRTDIFSFGSVLYEMLAGRKAFQKESTADTISAILREDPPELSDTNSSVAPGLERIVRRCLEKNREQRFHSASDLAFALDALSGTQSSGDARTAFSKDDGPLAQRRWPTAKLGWITSAASLALMVGLAILYFQRMDRKEQVLRFTFSAPVKTIFGDSAALSPDGLQVAFVAVEEGGGTSLWVRSLQSLDARPLPGTEGAAQPFWSPDNRYIGFFAEGKLKKIEISNGTPIALADAALDARGGSWGPDGTIVFSPGILTPLYKIPSAGGVASPVTALDPERSHNSHRWPSFLPDGKHFLYFARGSKDDHQGVYVGSLDFQESKFLFASKLMAVYSPPDSHSEGHLLFVRDSVLFAQPFDVARLELSGEAVPVANGVLSFPLEAGPTAYSAVSVAANGTLLYRTGGQQNSQLSWIDRSGKDLGPVASPGLYHEPSLSGDGKRVFFTREDSGGQSDLFSLDLARGAATRLTFDPGPDVSPTLSPDGGQLIFSSNRNGNMDLYRKSATGTGSDELVLDSAGNLFPDDWSSDGRLVIYESANLDTNKSELWILPVTGDGKPFPYLQGPFSATHSQFSPDGRWVAYTSDESGRAEVYVQSFPLSGGKWQISTGGGDQPEWRPDGKELYYMSPDRTLMSTSINYTIMFNVGPASPLFQTRVPVIGIGDDKNNFVPASDGQRFLVNNQINENDSQPLTVVLNWAAESKR